MIENKGLSLVEVLISMAIFGILIVATTNLFFSGINIWDYGENVYNKLSDIDFFMKRFENDLKTTSPFSYCSVFKKNNGFLDNILKSYLNKGKLADNAKSTLINIPDYSEFFNGKNNNLIDIQNYFLSNDALSSWFNLNNNRENCWLYLKKELWERWIYNIPAFNWNDIGIFTEQGFFYNSLGDNFSYQKSQTLCYFFSEEEKKLYYYKIDSNTKEGTVTPQVILENVYLFNIKYYTLNNEIIEMKNDFIYTMPGLVRKFEIEIDIREDKEEFRKKKVFFLNLNRMK
ncbi:MAG: prepilin-type N-terminal cleavage/methylation domain-containing protein [Candidatus Muirbacterium halophilum]|nr:prepilin-type N-terminal cleavage/methylation domain-containing protein [Candidatus Muirbacterium halophilum]MCK9476930.1 prepilin-type N-terminal cleavage/methylation domain-containing protein [Candidatus Muirbacterium halophilum]